MYKLPIDIHNKTEVESQKDYVTETMTLLNDFQIPQIRYATPERLLQRLTDLRFLNIDFLNTFLLTYRH